MHSKTKMRLFCGTLLFLGIVGLTGSADSIYYTVDDYFMMKTLANDGIYFTNNDGCVNQLVVLLDVFVNTTQQSYDKICRFKDRFLDRACLKKLDDSCVKKHCQNSTDYKLWVEAFRYGGQDGLCSYSLETLYNASPDCINSMDEYAPYGNLVNILYSGNTVDSNNTGLVTAALDAVLNQMKTCSDLSLYNITSDVFASVVASFGDYHNNGSQLGQEPKFLVLVLGIIGAMIARK